MIAKWYKKIEEAFLFGLMCVAVLIVCYSVVMRYVFHNPVIWNEEIVCYIQVWLCFLGANYVARRPEDFIKFDFIRHKMGKKSAMAAALVECLLLSASMVLFAAVSWKWIAQIYSFGGISTPMRVPNFLPRMVVPFSFTLLAIRYIVSIKECIDAIRQQSDLDRKERN